MTGTPEDERPPLRTRVARGASELADDVATESDHWFLGTLDRLQRAYNATSCGLEALGRGALRGLRRPFASRASTQQRVEALLLAEAERLNPELRGEDFGRFAEGIGALVDHVVRGAIPVQDVMIVQQPDDAVDP